MGFPNGLSILIYWFYKFAEIIYKMNFTFALYLNELKEVIKDARLDSKNEFKRYLQDDFVKYFRDGVVKSNNDAQ